MFNKLFLKTYMYVFDTDYQIEFCKRITISASI